MNEEVQQVQPGDFEVAEAWLRQTDEPEIRNVEAIRIDKIGAWQVFVWVMEFIRSDPLETELRQRITSALRGVRGVTLAEADDIEVWRVTGTPSGKALAEAAAQVVDDLADQTRACLNRL